MAIAYVNAGSVSSAASVTTRTPGLPASRVNGNILLAVCSTGNNATHTWSGTGWNKIGGNINSGASFTTSIGWCIVNGSESAPTISWTGSAGVVALVWQLSGAHPTQTFTNLNTNSGSTSTHSATGFTGSAVGSRAVYIDSANANTGLATPSGWTEHSDTGAATFPSRITIGSKSIGTGASGNISVTGANAAWTMRIFELLQKYYTLAVTQQTYTVTANATGLYKGHKLTVDSQTYAITANDVTLSKSTSGYTLPVTSASYTVTANDVALLWKRILSVTKADYSITTQAVGLLFKRVLPATSQTYTTTANDVGLLWKRVLSVTQQSYTVTAQSVSLLWKRALSVAQAAYTVTAQTVGALWYRVLPVTQQTYTVTGNDVTLAAAGAGNATLSVDSQSYTVTANDVSFARARLLPVDNATYTATFNNVVLTYSGVSVDGVAYLGEQMPYQVYLTEAPHRIALKEYKVSSAVLVELSDSLMLDERMINNVMLEEILWTT